MSKIKVEFIIDHSALGSIVMLVEEIGATDFAFVALKDKPRKKYKTRQSKQPKPERQRSWSGKGFEITTGLLREKGTATRDEIGAALVEGGLSPRTMNGLLHKLEKHGLIARQGHGVYGLGRAEVS